MSDPTGAVEIRGLRVLAHHGALAGEQERAQMFEVDLDIEIDTAVPGRSDELADTLDYGAAVELVSSVMRARRFKLLEALASAVADAVLGMEHAGAVTVTVRKLHPPIAADLGSVGVRVRRSAGGSGDGTAGGPGGGAAADR